MPDRGKVNGFELCANGEPCIGEKFTSCPFSPRNNKEQNCGVTMARFTIALLKEQETEIENLKQTAQSMMEGVFLLKEREAEARLLTAEEVQNMEAGTAFGIETYYDHDGKRMPGCTWALRTESLILSYFGTMFPDTVTKIPYNTLEKNQNTGKQEKHQYRFWSKKPTFEQCQAVKWE